MEFLSSASFSSQWCLNIYFSDFHSQLNRLVFLCRYFFRIFFLSLLDSNSSTFSFSSLCIFLRQLFNSFFLFLHFRPRKCVKEIKFAVSSKSTLKNFCHRKLQKKYLLKIHNWTTLLGRIKNTNNTMNGVWKFLSKQKVLNVLKIEKWNMKFILRVSS